MHCVLSSQQFTLTGSMNSQKMACFSGEKTLFVDTELTKTLNVPGKASLQSHNGYLCHLEIANSWISAWSKLSKQERQMVENAITLHDRIHAMKVHIDIVVE